MCLDLVNAHCITKKNTQQKPVHPTSHIDTELGKSLWKQLTHAVILTDQLRVIDKPYNQLLDRLRYGQCTDEDYQILSTRIVSQSSDIHVQDYKQAPVIVPRYKLVRAHSKVCNMQNMKTNS